MIVYENSKVKIEYDQDKQRITQTWTGFAPSVDFRNAIDATTKFMESNTVKTIISDTINQEVVKREDTEYARLAMPKMFQHGLEAMAFVLPENIFTQISLKKFADKGATESVQYFKSIAEAVNWLDKNYA
ncbi:hypothetical protein R9C00_14885 [Flammeovirgaceae bacterium SG7u.111]|nr:hypothetical protein [Flammeovirgaceae bacterium SG7u.132]WPO38744.1 hypothetical protein R9C00_14885 [Flammeovirgaceae bacterium SG7u.111]